MSEDAGSSGSAKGDFIAPPAMVDQDEPGDALPHQEEFWRPPVRFGSVPVEKEPLGWDRRRVGQDERTLCASAWHRGRPLGRQHHHCLFGSPWNSLAYHDYG